MIRALVAIVLLFLAAIVAAVVWQPHDLQQWAVKTACEKIAESTPYRLEVGGIHGNAFTHLTFTGLRVSTAENASPLLTADQLKIGIHWHSLLEKQVRISRFTVVRPVISLAVGRDGQLSLPAFKSKTSTTTPSEFQLYGDHLAIEDGEFSIKNNGATPPGELTFRHIDAQAKWSHETLTLESAQLTFASGTAELRGSVRVSTSPVIELSVTTKRFPLHDLMRWQKAPPTALRLVQSGRWRLERSKATWSVSEQGELAGVPWRVQATRDDRGPFKATVDVSPVNVESIWASTTSARAGKVAFVAEVAGPSLNDLRGVTLNGGFTLDQSSSGLKVGRVFNAEAHLIKGQGPVLATCRMDGLQADATSQIDLRTRQLTSAFSVDISSFAALRAYVPALENARGHVTASGHLSGPLDHLTLNAKANGSHLDYKHHTLDTVVITMAGGFRPDGPLKIDASASDITLDDRVESPWDPASVTVHAVRSSSVWQGTADSHFRNGDQFHYDGTVRQSVEGEWTLDWNGLSLALEGGRSFSATTPGELRTLPNGGVELSRVHFSDGSGGTFVVDHGEWTTKTIILNLNVHHFAIEPVLRQAAPGTDLTGTLDGEIHWQGTRADPAGTVELALSSGAVHGVAYDRVHAAGDFEGSTINVRDLSILVLDHQKVIEGHGQLPWHLIDGTAPNEPMKLTVDIPRLEAPFFTALFPGLTIDRGGELMGHLVFAGISPNILVNGTLKGDSSHIAIKSWGVDLRSLVIDVESHDNTLTIRKIGGQTPKGPIELSGSSKLPDLNYKIVGHDVVLNLPKRIEAIGAINLKITGDLEGPDVSGRIRLQEGTYTTPKADKKVKKDVRPAAVADTEPSPMWEGTTLDIAAQWSRNVWYRDGLTKIETEGDIHLKKDEETITPYMSGRIGIIRGTYDAYGKDFVLDSGDIVFTGPPDINPILNMRAIYQNPGATVYLDVKGTAKNPSLNFTSNPAMSPQDIISVLVLGTPLSQINANQPATTNQPLQPGQFYQSNQPGGVSPLGQNNQAAPTQSQSQSAELLAGNVIGGYISKGLRESGMDLLGLDVVRIDPGTEGNHLTVGRYIGSKLFVSYGQPLQGASSQLFNASYYITKRWTLEGQTGSSIDSFMDFIFRYPTNTPHHKKKSKGPELPVPPAPPVPSIAQ